MARIFRVGRDQVKAWAYHFKEFLSPEANPPKGATRQFRDDDLPVLAYIYYHWEEAPDLESIKQGLSTGDCREERFEEVLYLHSKIFQEPPDELDETWNHGFLFLGSRVGDAIGVAQCYRLAVDEMIAAALRSNEAHKYDYPILFLCRHTLELYLKLLGSEENKSHSLEKCIGEIEKIHGRKLGQIFRAWIEEFSRMDEGGTMFRYADSGQHLCYIEYWIDLRQLRYSMDRLCSVFEEAFWKSNITLSEQAAETVRAAPNRGEESDD